MFLVFATFYCMFALDVQQAEFFYQPINVEASVQ